MLDRWIPGAIRRRHGAGTLSLAILVAGRLAWPAAIAGQGPADDTAILFLKIPTVQGASRFDQAATEAPASVSVVTAEEIRRQGWRTLGEIVSTVRGFFTTFDRAYTYVATRGFGRPGDFSNRVLLLIDGQGVNEPIYGSSAYGTESMVDVEDIERVEFIRGPGSSLYGTNAFFGVINVITRRGRELSGGRVRVVAGSYGTAAAEARYGRRFDSGLELYVSSQVYRQEGQTHFYPEFQASGQSDGIAEFDRDERKHLLVKLTAGTVTLEGVYNDRAKQIPTASYGTVFNDPRAELVDAQGYLSASWARAFSDGRRIAASVGLHSYRYSGGFPQEDGYYGDASSSEWIGADASYLRLLGRRHKVIFGGEYRLGLAQQQSSWKLGEPVTRLGNDSRDDLWGIFAQDEVRLGAVLLNIGARYDHLESYGGTLNPRAALVYGWGGGAAKLLYGRAFRAPSNFELFYEDGYSVKASPDLMPERIVTTEVVLEQRLGAHLRGVLSLYRYQASDLITQIRDPADDLLAYRNNTRADGQGIEAELDFEFSAFQGRVSYALQRSRDAETKAVLTNSPRHLGQLSISRALFEDKLIAGATMQAMSSRTAESGAITPAFALANLSLRSRRMLGRMGGTLGVYNLWNTRYADPVGEEHLQRTLRQDGRQVQAAFSLDF
jgi:iron complex outermembrane receptor protein